MLVLARYDKTRSSVYKNHGAFRGILRRVVIDEC